MCKSLFWHGIIYSISLRPPIWNVLPILYSLFCNKRESKSHLKCSRSLCVVLQAGRSFKLDYTSFNEAWARSTTPSMIIHSECFLIIKPFSSERVTFRTLLESSNDMSFYFDCVWSLDIKLWKCKTIYRNCVDIKNKYIYYHIVI